MRIVISIFALPYEIDELEKTLFQLKRSSQYLSNDIEWVLDVTMCTANDMVNWKKSSIPKSFFVDKMFKLSSQTDWCAKYFKTSDEIKGCVSQRRHSLIEHEDADYFIWLDTDIIFDERTLPYIEQTIRSLHPDYPNSIITPEIVRIWDNTWDCLVNENFIDKPLDYHKTNDPFIDCGIKGEISVESVHNSIPNQPRFKFAGGWFTCISGDLLRRIGVPESFGHYGYEDTFVMWGAQKLLQEQDIDIHQFKIKNLVVCENYKYRGFAEYVDNMTIIDRREEFKQLAQSNFKEELDKI